MKKSLFFIPLVLFLCAFTWVRQTYIVYEPLSQSCFITENLTIFSTDYAIEDKNSNKIFIPGSSLIAKIDDKTLTISDVKKLLNISTECHDFR